MPHFTLTIDPAGPVLNAVVSVSEGRRAALVAEKIPVPQAQAIRALVDTGASLTSIEADILQALQLTPTGKVDIVTPSTGPVPHTTDTYDIDFVILKGPKEPPLAIQNLRVAASELFAAQGIHALIGRDVLTRCILIYNGETNEFTLSF